MAATSEVSEEQGEAEAAAKPGLLERLASFTKTMSWSNKSIPPEEVEEAAVPKVEAKHHVMIFLTGANAS